MESGENIAAAVATPIFPDRTIVALSERVAIVETQQRALKEDTGVIRLTMHAFAQDMQKFVISEQRCADYLSAIAKSTEGLPVLATAVAGFIEMRPELHDVLQDRARREGVASFGRRMGMVIATLAGFVAMLGGIGAGLVWLAQHLRPV